MLSGSWGLKLKKNICLNNMLMVLWNYKTRDKKMKIKKLGLAAAAIAFLLCSCLLPVAKTAAAGSGSGTQSNNITLNARQAVLQATSAAQIQTQVQAFLNQYGLTVSLGCPTAATQSGNSCIPSSNTNYGALKAYSVMLIEEISKYPTGIIAGHSFAVNTIYLPSNVLVAGPNGFAGAVAGVYYDGFGVVFNVGYNTSDAYRRVIHHEFMHYLDFQTRSTGLALDQTAWQSNNPNGFSYSNYSSTCFEGSDGCAANGAQTGFVSDYAKNAYVEDVAETEAYLMTELGDAYMEPLLQTDTRLAAKVAIIKSFLAGLDSSVNDSYLLAMHNFGQTYNGEFDSFFGDKVVDSTTQTTTIPATQDFTGLTWAMGVKGLTDILIVDGTLGDIIVEGGTLKGTGTVGALQVFDGSSLAPGHSPGCLNSGNLTLGGEYQVEIGGTTACSGYDQMRVTGTVDVTGGTLTPSLYGGFVPSVGQSFTIITNDGADAVTGTFTNAAGNKITAGGVSYSVSYIGGDGNDVVLTVTAIDPSLAAASSAPVPKTPNTGFKFIDTHPLISLVITISCAIPAMYAAYRLKRAV
jgi:hypothetical protein